MEGDYEDDYTRTLLVHPAEARADNKFPQPSGDFKRTIEKMQKAIQLHSIKKKPTKRSNNAKDKAFRARDEFNPFLHNAWLMMGRAQYFSGDFLAAASTFLYISKHFTWLPNVVTEARLWQARCYCALDWNYEAENILRLVKEKDLTSKSLKNLYNVVKADYFVRTEQYEEAVPFLREAAATSSGAQKHRLWFLLGQVYAHLGQKQLAYEAFKKAGSGAAISYRTKFNARIKQSEVFTGQNIRKEVNALKALTRFERNKEYLDQIYYAIGNLYLSRGDTAEAKKNYILAVEKSTRSGIDKALAQLSLGTIYFDESDYVKAQPCYSEAVPLLPESFPNYKMLRRRSDVLDELAVYSGNVQLQDSLLELSKMTPEEQEKVAQRLVDELNKKEKEEEEAAKREEYMAQQEQNNLMDKNAPTATPGMNTDKSWYFYNAMTKNAGKTEFQRKWGARKLEDDWRRRNKSSFSFDDEDEENAEDNGENIAENDSISTEEKEKLEKENDPHYVEYYLKQIPKTEEEIQVANDVIQEGLYNMGIILKDKLEDFPAARSEFDKLDSRYPDNIYRLDVYYNMYLMAVREDNKPLAETWRQKILQDFPDSPYGKAMADPNYFDNLRRMHDVQEEMYATAYAAYLADNNDEVHTLTADMEKDYPLSPILPKFVFIDALSYLTEGDNDQFRERLTELLQKWPDTDMTDMASAIVKGLKAGRVPHAGLSNSRGMLWEIRLTNSEAADGEGGEPAKFEHDPNSPQYLVFAFPTDSVNPNLVLYDVARFNFSSFIVKDFDLEQMSFSNIGLLIVKGFANLNELEHYRTVMEKSDLNLPPEVRPIMISKANFDLLLREGRSFEEYFRFQEQKTVEQTEEDVVGPDMTMPPGPDEESSDEDPDASQLNENMDENQADELPDDESVDETPDDESIHENYEEESVMGNPEETNEEPTTEEKTADEEPAATE
ncbi:MAG: tetratricopeptide repeat protein [Bacteroides sp.]|nr:tetratricopeptide repeat protein [Bacteroides sp.]